MIQIYESAIEAATNTDVLAGTRLNAIPYNGTLTLRAICQLNDATNFITMTIQTPDGDVPVDTQRIPACNPALVGIMDDRMCFQMSFRARAGGHFNIGVTETGTAVAYWVAVLRP